LQSLFDLEREVMRFAANDGRGIALRFGSFYGPEARSLDEMLQLARKGVAPFMGRPDAYMSSIHTDDAASAVVASIGLPTGVYNVCDEPLTRRAVADAFADAFGTHRLHFVPQFVQRMTARKRGDALMRSQRVSNRKFREATGWEPAFPDASVGLVDSARRARTTDR
jgi:nucleoside-diphosphate-sugar epimerase